LATYNSFDNIYKVIRLVHNNEMRKKTRRLLFFTAVLLFVVIGCGAVLFALGYKYDFVHNKFLKIGSFELKTNVAAEVYVNDVLAGETSFLSNSFSKSRLLPRTYTVRVQNENYQSWQKLVKVEAGFFIYFPRVVLVPKNFNEEIIASSSISLISVKRFETESGLAIIGNKQKLESIDLKTGEVKPFKEIVKKETAPLVDSDGSIISPDNTKTAWANDHEVWVKWLKDSDYQPFKKTGETEFVIRFSQKADDMQWYKDSSHLIVSSGSILKFVEIDKRGGVNINDISAISGPFYYDHGIDAIFKFEGNRVVRIGLSY